MVMAQISSQMVINMLVSTHMVSLKDSDNTNGRMARLILGPSSMELNMVKVSGDEFHTTILMAPVAIFTTVPTLWTKNMAKAVSNGNLVTLTLEITIATIDTVTVKCSGQMALTTKACGAGAFNKVQD